VPRLIKKVATVTSEVVTSGTASTRLTASSLSTTSSIDYYIPSIMAAGEEDNRKRMRDENELVSRLKKLRVSSDTASKVADRYEPRVANVFPTSTSHLLTPMAAIFPSSSSTAPAPSCVSPVSIFGTHAYVPNFNDISPGPSPPMHRDEINHVNDFFHPDAQTMCSASDGSRSPLHQNTFQSKLSSLAPAPLFRDEDGDVAHDFLEEMDSPNLSPTRDDEMMDITDNHQMDITENCTALVPWLPNLKQPNFLRQRTDLLALSVRELKSMVNKLPSSSGKTHLLEKEDLVDVLMAEEDLKSRRARIEERQKNCVAIVPYVSGPGDEQVHLKQRKDVQTMNVDPYKTANAYPSDPYLGMEDWGGDYDIEMSDI